MIKQVQSLCGVSPGVYWASCLFFDLTLVAVPFLVFTIIIAPAGLRWLDGLAPLAFILLFMLGMAATLSCLYLLTWQATADDPEAGQRRVMIPFIVS